MRRFWPIVTGILVAATSCSLNVPSDVGTINLYVSVDKGTLPRDSSVTITVTARNVGFDRITLTGASDCLLFVQVRDHTGLVVYNTNSNCTGSVVTETLEAGADKVQNFVWNGSSGTGARLPSGFYTIYGIAQVTGAPYIGPPLSITLE